MTEAHPEPRLLPIPDNFRFEWANPEDARLPLIQDRQHIVSPITPLSSWVHENYWARGATDGFAAMKQPVGMSVRRINTYYYMAVHPVVPPEQMEEAGHAAEAALKAAAPLFVGRWADEWEPEINGYHTIWEAFDLASASDTELLDHLDWSTETYARLWHIHFEGLMPGFLTVGLFVELYADLVEDSGPLDAYNLLQGIDNSSLRAGTDLWEVGQSITSREVRETLINTPTGEVMEALSKTSDGQKAAEGISEYLDKWGRRSDTVIEFADPSWVEDPSIAIDNLKGYLRNPDSDPVAKWKELVLNRKRLVEEAQELIAGYPDPVKQQFNQLLGGAQQGQRIQEDHNWWIDQQGTHYVRQVFLEFGNRLAASGAIAERDDVFMLSGDEMIESAKAGHTGDFRSLVAERKAEMETWEKVEAPLMLGTDYGPPPDNPLMRALFGKFFVYDTAPEPGDEAIPGLLRGVSGSGGKVTGTARVIIKLSDAGRLSPGDILVTTTTSPPWTPLFATAGGIVTDTGGALSHCAIVAREYSLPATVGTGNATTVIADGQQIEVDGDAGTVRIL